MYVVCYLNVARSTALLGEVVRINQEIKKDEAQDFHVAFRVV
jgi:hypothetical protein